MRYCISCDCITCDCNTGLLRFKLIFIIESTTKQDSRCSLLKLGCNDDGWPSWWHSSKNLVLARASNTARLSRLTLLSIDRKEFRMLACVSVVRIHIQTPALADLLDLPLLQVRNKEPCPFR